MSIDGKNAEVMSHHEAVNTIRDCKDTVTLLIRRPMKPLVTGNYKLYHVPLPLMHRSLRCVWERLLYIVKYFLLFAKKYLIPNLFGSTTTFLNKHSNSLSSPIISLKIQLIKMNTRVFGEKLKLIIFPSLEAEQIPNGHYGTRGRNATIDRPKSGYY